MFQLAAARCEILPEMAAYQAVDQIDEPVDNEEPGEEEVPAPPGGEVAVAGQGHRPGKASNLVIAIGRIGEAEQIGGVDVPAGDGGHAHDLLAMLHRPHGHHRIVEIRFSSEIELWMSVEDLQSAHQQHE